MDWKRLYTMYYVTSRRLTRARSVFRVPGVAVSNRNLIQPCIMTSRTRAGVKILLSPIENVWGIDTPPDKNVCNL